MKTWKRTVLVLAVLALGLSKPRQEPPAAESEIVKEPPAAESEIVNSIGMRLVRIPAGEFLMGCEEPVEQLLVDARLDVLGSLLRGLSLNVR